MTMGDRPQMLVLGAGAAGLAIAHTLSEAGVSVTIAEGSGRIGGLSTTVDFAGGLVDLGPHVIGAAYPRVNALFEGALGEDAVKFQRRTTMLWKDRVFSYPPGILEIAKGLGVMEAARICSSYGKSRLSNAGDAPANYRIAANRKFGKRLVDTCIAPYLEKLWGMPCENIDGGWEPGRVRNQSFLRLALSALTSKEDRTVTHPRLGAKQFYDKLAESMTTRDVQIDLNRPVTSIHHDGARVTSINFDGAPSLLIGEGEHRAVFSTLPLPAVVSMLNPAPPDEIIDASRCLTFRNTILVYLLVPGRTRLNDHIRYINDHRYNAGRVTNFSIWTDGMAQAPVPAGETGPVTTICVELWTGFDSTWEKDDETVVREVVQELRELDILEDDRLLEHKIIRVPRTHPICTTDAVKQLRKVQTHLATIKGLYIAGRAGSFLYADQDRIIDQSMQIAEQAIEDVGGHT